MMRDFLNLPLLRRVPFFLLAAAKTCPAAPGELLPGAAVVTIASPSPYNSAVDNLGSAVLDKESKLSVGGKFFKPSGSGNAFFPRISWDGAYEVSPYRDWAGVALLTGEMAYTTGNVSGGGLLQRWTPGGRDDSFTFANESPVTVCAVVPEGKIIVGRAAGKGPTLLRLAWDATMDSSWNPTVTSHVSMLSATPDGGCYAATAKSEGSSEVVLVRVKPDGALDPGFAAELDDRVLSMAALPDGGLIAGGAFQSVNHQPRGGLVRFLPDGSVDELFLPVLTTPAPGIPVTTVFPQADGALLITGSFTAVNGVPRPGMARLRSDGSLDESFKAPAVFASSPVRLLAHGPDGSLAAAAAIPNGAQFFRLENGQGASSLEITGDNRIVWMRGGSLPELSAAQFEFRAEGSATWSFLGRGQRVAGGWGMANLVPPATPGALRAAGWTSGNPGNTMVSQAVPVGSAAPKLQVTSGVNFQQVMTGSTGTASLILRNTGNGRQENLSLALEGADKDQFSILSGPAPGSTLDPDSSVRITLGFTPRAAGNASASLRILGNTPLSPLVEAAWLSGSGTTALTGIFNSPQTAFRNVSSFDPRGKILGPLSFSFAPAADFPLTLVSNTGTAPLPGTFQNLAQGAFVELSSYLFTIDYQGGDGNDIVLRRVWAGGLDREFEVLNDTQPDGVLTCARQRDGKLLMGGDFTAVHGQARAGLARLKRNGSLDPLFDARLPAGTVLSFISELENGKILIGGTFGDGTIQEVRRLLPDGGADPAFLSARMQHPSVGSEALRAVLPLPDNGVLVAGTFETLNGQPRHNIALLDEKGLLAPGFTPPLLDLRISCALRQPDGKFLLSVPTMNGVSTGGLVRLNEDGTVDTSFKASILGAVRSLSLLPDGRIICGDYSVVDRLKPTGGLDKRYSTSGFPTVSPAVLAFTDGKVVINATILSGVSGPRQHLIRLNQNMLFDANFDARFTKSPFSFDEPVRMLCPQDGGRFLAGGNLPAVSGEKWGQLVQLLVEQPVESLTIPEPATVRWLRGGGLPEATSVSFALYDSATAGWTPLGAGSAVPGGWERTGLALPEHGTIRATASVASGWRNGSYSLFDSFVSFGTVVSAVRAQSIGTGAGPVASGGSLSLDPVAAGGTRRLVLSLSNQGEGPLILGQPQFSGDQGTFFVTAGPELKELQASQQTELEITFHPAAAGQASAVLTIPTNDPLTPAFTINLSAAVSPATPRTDWLLANFGNTDATGDAADTGDPDRDGLTNFGEYALGTNPNLGDSAARPQVTPGPEGGLEIRFTPPLNRADVSYTAEWAEDPGSGTWKALDNLGSHPEYLFHLKTNEIRKAFMRLRFTQL